MVSIKPATAYRQVDDLCIVTSYFNPMGYQSRYRNYIEFERSILDSGLTLITAECAFGETPFELPASSHIIKFRSNDVIWLKERLLNLAIAKLPASFKKVAWVDCDVLFENKNWAVETSRLLEDYPIVQPFYYAFELPPNQREYKGIGDKSRSFAAIHSAFPSISRVGDFKAHGHTGFAWAARRDVLEILKLYDAAIAGSSDHLMAHAFCGDFASKCLQRTMLDCDGYLKHFKQWAKSAWTVVGGRLGFVLGGLFHLWHGQKRNRRYSERNYDLSRLDFDPVLDLLVERNGLWGWSKHNPGLRKWALEYFAARREDDATSITRWRSQGA